MNGAITTSTTWVDKLLTPDPTRPPEPVPLSDSLKQVAVELLYGILQTELDPRMLHELAWLAEHESPRSIARRGLSDEGIEILTEILISGGVPTIGFWRHNRAA